MPEYLVDVDANLIDVETLASQNVNLDGLKGLVTASEGYGRLDSGSSKPFRIGYAQLDTHPVTSLYPQIVLAYNFGFNGTTFDRWRNNTEGTLLASAARTATTYSTDQTNYNHKGIYIFVNVTAIVTAPSITVRLEMKDSISGLYTAITASSAAITAVGKYILALHPALIDTAGIFHLACDAMLPRTWRLRVLHGNANSITYSVSCQSVV